MSQIKEEKRTPGVVMCFAVLASWAIIAFAGCYPPPPDIRGEVKVTRSQDSLVLNYDLVPLENGHRIDSVLISLKALETIVGGDSIVYSSHGSVVGRYPHRNSEWYRSRPWLEGQLVYTDADTNVTGYEVKTYTTGGFWSDKANPSRSHYLFEQPPGYGMLFRIGTTYLDEFRVKDQDRVTTGHWGADFELGGTAYRDDVTGLISGSIRDDGNNGYNRSIFEIRIGGRYHYGGRDKLWPAPCLSVGVSGVYTVGDDEKVLQGTPDARFGFLVESKYERFTYTYNTNFGGFHKVDALFAFAAHPRGKVGTQYTLCRGVDLSEFRVSLYLEGMSSDLRQMVYAGRRSVLQKTLSAGFFAPLYLLVEVLSRMD